MTRYRKATKSCRKYSKKKLKNYTDTNFRKLEKAQVFLKKPNVYIKLMSLYYDRSFVKTDHFKGRDVSDTLPKDHYINYLPVLCG